MTRTQRLAVAAIALLLLAYAAFTARPLFAQTTCAAPPKNTDGSSITKAITFTVYDGGTAVCTTSSVSAGFTSLAVGAHPFTVTAKTADGESAASNVATKTVLPSPPNPPTSLTV